MKKLLAMVMVLALVAGLGACGGSGGESTSSTGGKTSAVESGGTSDTANTGSTGEIKTVILAFPTWTGAPVDAQLVQDAMNDITKEKLGIEVQLQISDSGSYKQNMTLAMTGGEKIDVMSTLLAEYSSCVQQGYLRDMEADDLLATYGSGIIEAVGQENIDACRVGGVLYGVPNNRDFAQGRGSAVVATQYLEGIGYEFPDNDEEIIKITLDELNEIYAKLHETYPDKEVYRPVTGSMNQFSNIDNLGGSVFGVLLDYGQDLTVENLFTSDYYRDYCQRMYDYNQKGYISQDAVTDTTAVGEIVKAGTLMSYTTGGKPGIKAQETSLCGEPVTVFQTDKDFITSAAIASFPWTIPESSTEPEAGMTLLNEFYTNPDLANLLSWGVDGVHYTATDDGFITYPEGLDAATSGWNHSMGWLMPNQFITHVWEGNAADLWEEIDTFNKEGVRSKASGFTFNSENVQTEVTAVQNVYDEYQKSLEYGMVDPATGIDEMNQKMMNAGLQNIIDEKQAQLDEWAKAQG